MTTQFASNARRIDAARPFHFSDQQVAPVHGLSDDVDRQRDAAGAFAPPA